jgi:hypothetical protein
MPIKNPHPLYSVWQSMLNRCRNPNARAYPDYGGRGITVCDEWRDFDQFVADMGPRPVGMSLDRIDNDGNYTPSNCRWATRKEQQRNQRRAVFVTIEGTRYRAIELAEQAGVKTDTIVKRAAMGLPFDVVMSKDRLPVEEGAWKRAVTARVAKQRAQTHCANGHPRTPDNVSITPQGWTRCKACHREKMRRLYERRRMACDAA